jgi:cysteine-rich repeat protein
MVHNLKSRSVTVLNCISIAMALVLALIAPALAEVGGENEAQPITNSAKLRGRLNPLTDLDPELRSHWTPPQKADIVASLTSQLPGDEAGTEAIDAPALCSGYGTVQPIYSTNWEAGLGTWIPDTRRVEEPLKFDTPDWAAVGSLPDGRSGLAAFVANINTLDCVNDNETGVLTLTSPTIVIPQNAEVPRIAFDHWYATEKNYDGGNLRYSVNGEFFRQVPASAIEVNSYDQNLFSLNDGNSNPLAGEGAWTGNSEAPSSNWIQSWVNLYDLAKPGDSIQIRFDFGIDQCRGVTGWYVDDFQVYSCSEELPPSLCGNGELDADEECDDGNNFIGDGCSNVCLVEDGWECTEPVSSSAVRDGGFELGVPNSAWDEGSTNFGTPLCDEDSCGVGTGSGPASGDWWAWFGGIEIYDLSFVQQLITIPEGVTELRFQVEASYCDSPTDYLEVEIDGVTEFTLNGASPICGLVGYRTQTIDISEYADNSVHSLRFQAETFAINGDVSNFFVDDVVIPGAPSECTPLPPKLTLKKAVVNDNGGSANPAQWTLAAQGPTPFSGPGPTVNGPSNLAPGTYQLLESGGPAGYNPSNWVCTGASAATANSVTLEPGNVATCTITNDDQAPSLTLAKTMVNDNGGTAKASDWTLSAARFGVVAVIGPGPSVPSGDDLQAGTYTLHEAGGPSGYTASAWVCSGDGSQPSNNSITLGIGEAATCTITNDDDDPSNIVIRDGFEASAQ